jgi:energy-coupling factor transporter ATP-binding protein EcfA2
LKGKPLPLIKVVGISGSGKSTLVNCLRSSGYDARPVSQEHSDIPDLWQRFDRPFVLIYLFVGLSEQKLRRPQQTSTYTDFMREQMRLANAREEADLRVDTSNMEPQQVCDLVITYLRQINVACAEEPLQPVRATGSATRTQDQ